MLQFDYERARKMCRQAGISKTKDLGFDQNKLVAVFYRNQFYDMLERAGVLEVPTSLIMEISAESEFFKDSLFFKHDGEREIQDEIRKLSAVQLEQKMKCIRLTHEKKSFIDGTGIRYAAVTDERERVLKDKSADPNYLHFLNLFLSVIKLSGNDDDSYIFTCDYSELEYFFSEYLDRLKAIHFDKEAEYYKAYEDVARFQKELNELDEALRKNEEREDNLIIVLPSGRKVKVVNE